MRQKLVRNILLVALVISSAFAVWAWMRPYAWRPDSAARCKVVETLVTRDAGFCWVNVHVKMIPGMSHDLEKSVELETGDGQRFGPADTTFGGEDFKNPEEVWFRFWLEREVLASPLVLHVNDGSLAVKSTSGIPQIDDGEFRNFTTHRW